MSVPKAKIVKYQATFSNGETVTRGSHRGYIKAVAVIKKETGKVRNIKFSSQANPAPDWTGISQSADRWMSNADRTKLMERNEKAKALYTVEVVDVEVVTK